MRFGVEKGFGEIFLDIQSLRRRGRRSEEGLAEDLRAETVDDRSRAAPFPGEPGRISDQGGIDFKRLSRSDASKIESKF